MAIDASLKLEIRAVYESNNLSVAKVLERFPSCEVSAKTVESWVKKENWTKNRFKDEKIAISELVESTLPIEEAKEIVKTKLLSPAKTTQDEDFNPSFTDIDFDLYGKVVAKELCYDENLLRAKRFVDNSKNIGTNATYHNMLTTTVKTLYGEIKHINPNMNKKTYTDEELEQMSIEELDRLLS